MNTLGMNVLRIGVIGAGVMGSDHARAIATATSGARLVAIADIDEARAGALADELGGVRALHDASALIRLDDVDAVVIASHDTTHVPLVLECLAAGKPVLCEKPLSLDVAGCKQIVAAERALHRRLVSVGFSRRFDPALVELKAALDAGVIGRPLVAHAIHRNVSSDPGAPSEDAILGSAIHECDQMPWLLGAPVTEVSWHAPASTSHAGAHKQDPQVLHLRTHDGTLTIVEVFVNAVYGYDVRLEVVGETGTLSLANPASVIVNTARTQQTTYPADWRPRYAAAYRAEMQAWVNAATTGQYGGSALADARDGQRATVVAHALIASMHAAGARVPVNDESEG
jgi:myo-inositol 2-dehydrogenase/D-chiro-inositol 1-dehydrogenase